jgi:serine/threonine protein kinase
MNGGEVAQRYALLRRIASGGMGEVFLAGARGAEGFEKRVAIKRIRPDLANDARFLPSFVDEAMLAVSLSHANLVQVFDLVRSGDDLLLVMELVDGPNLVELAQASFQRGDHIPAPIILYVAAEVLKGLAYAHERPEGGVIHCDISASNLLVSYAGEVKIIDFGIAQGHSRELSPGAGKPSYMAPEQLNKLAIDCRTDIYSLGVVLARLIGGSRGAPNALLMHGKELRPDVPTGLFDLIVRATAEDPAARPASARSMLSEVTTLSRLVDVVTAPDVGHWVERLVPPNQEVGEPPRTRAERRITQAQWIEPTTLLRARPHSTLAISIAPRAAPASSRSRLRLGLGALAVALVAASVATSPGAPDRPPEPERAHDETPSERAPSKKIDPPPPPPPEAAVAEPAESSSSREARAVPDQAPAGPTRTTPSKREAIKPRPSSGFVNVYAEPWADVWIDGKLIGTTPIMRARIEAGEHRLELRNPSFPSLEKRLHIRKGATELVDVRLKP